MKRSIVNVVLIAALLSCSLVLSGCLPFLLLSRSGNNNREEQTEETYETVDIDDILSFDDDDDDYDDKFQSDLMDDFSLDDTAWKTTGDGSYLVFENDREFKFYESEDEDADSFEGTYDVYVGEDAVDYVTEDLESYGVMKDELQRLFDNNEEYDTANFTCLVLHCDACYIDNENTLDEPYDRPYFGWFLKDDDKAVLDLASMNSAEYVTFVKQED